MPAKTFNVGSYRRADTPQPTADFFNESNSEGERLRQAAAKAAVTDMVEWFEKGEGIVAILDATNSTKARRRWVHERCEANNIETMYVESKCDDEDLVMSNILEVKTTSPDYKGQDPEVAAQDFRDRIRNYEKVYQTIDEDEKDLTYVKLIDLSQQVIVNGIKDYLQSRVVYYLMNLHIKPRSIWLSRVSGTIALSYMANSFRCQTANVLFSTASQNITLKAKSVVTLTSPNVASSTPKLFPAWLRSLLSHIRY